MPLNLPAFALALPLGGMALKKKKKKTELRKAVQVPYGEVVANKNTSVYPNVGDIWSMFDIIDVTSSSKVWCAIATTSKGSGPYQWPPCLHFPGVWTVWPPPESWILRLMNDVDCRKTHKHQNNSKHVMLRSCLDLDLWFLGIFTPCKSTFFFNTPHLDGFTEAWDLKLIHWSSGRQALGAPVVPNVYHMVRYSNCVWSSLIILSMWIYIKITDRLLRGSVILKPPGGLSLSKTKWSIKDDTTRTKQTNRPTKRWWTSFASAPCKKTRAARRKKPTSFLVLTWRRCWPLQHPQPTQTSHWCQFKTSNLERKKWPSLLTRFGVMAALYTWGKVFSRVQVSINGWLIPVDTLIILTYSISLLKLPLLLLTA